MTNQSKTKIIRSATSDMEIEKCFPVMKELRPHFSAEQFVAQVKKQMKDFGFQLIYLESAGEIKSVAGIRISEWLAGGKYLEIDDLFSKSEERSKGFGRELFEWIVDYARSENCRQIKLVSHVRRKDAHRFYLNMEMEKEAYYFSLML